MIHFTSLAAADLNVAALAGSKAKMFGTPQSFRRRFFRANGPLVDNPSRRLGKIQKRKSSPEGAAHLPINPKGERKQERGRDISPRYPFSFLILLQTVSDQDHDRGQEKSKA